MGLHLERRWRWEEAQAWMEEKLAAAAPATPPYNGDAPLTEE